MTVTASATVEVAASPQECLELVLDLERYRLIDPKIRRVLSAPPVDADGHRRVRYIGSMWHLPPAPDTQLVALDRWTRLTFTGAPNVPARTIFAFTGGFEAEAIPGGTRLIHTYDMTFRGPFRLVEPRLQRWLRADIAEEATRLTTELGPIQPVA